jgi:hypothetical protein
LDTYYDEHLPESSIEILGHSAAGATYRHDAHRAPLDDARIFVKHKSASDIISFEQLSEGELQLLTVLGLLRITRQDHCLFLLDEPDTHLNPIWKLRYFDRIDEAMRQDDSETVRKLPLSRPRSLNCGHAARRVSPTKSRAV